MDAYPETEKPLNAFADVLMCGPSSLTRAEREVIATFVSHRNECQFCTACHAAIAEQLLGVDGGLMNSVLADLGAAPLSDKLQSARQWMPGGIRAALPFKSRSVPG